MQRLDMALKRLGIRMAGVFSNALVTPEAVLTPEEKEEGVAVVDVGGGVTDVTVYYHNVVRYIACIPMGATAINRDIRTMGVPERLVESLKLRYGSAVAELAPEDKLVRVNGRTAATRRIFCCATWLRSSRRALPILLSSLPRKSRTRVMPTAWPAASS